jgi:hypothetical protein
VKVGTALVAVVYMVPACWGLGAGGIQTATYVRYLLGQLPALRPLSLILKQLLVERGLNDPYSGGLSSYGLVLMLAFVLIRRRHRHRHRHGPGERAHAGMSLHPTSTGVGHAATLPGTAQVPTHRREVVTAETEPDLGQALLEFLRFYGEEFSPLSQGISVRKGEVYMLPRPRMAEAAQPEERISAPQRDPLVIEDPTNPFNNVGRTCFGVSELQRALSEAFRAVTEKGVLVGERKPSMDSENSVLGRLFGTQHHRSVVRLVRQVWCPEERPPPDTASGYGGSSSPLSASAIRPNAKVGCCAQDARGAWTEAWAAQAFSLLSGLAARQTGVCVCCSAAAPRHTADCELMALLGHFPEQPSTDDDEHAKAGPAAHAISVFACSGGHSAVECRPLIDMHLPVAQGVWSAQQLLPVAAATPQAWSHPEPSPTTLPYEGWAGQ